MKRGYHSETNSLSYFTCRKLARNQNHISNFDGLKLTLYLQIMFMDYLIWMLRTILTHQGMYKMAHSLQTIFSIMMYLFLKGISRKRCITLNVIEICFRGPSSEEVSNNLGVMANLAPSFTWVDDNTIVSLIIGAHWPLRSWIHAVEWAGCEHQRAISGWRHSRVV